MTNEWGIVVGGAGSQEGACAHRMSSTTRGRIEIRIKNADDGSIRMFG